MTHKRFSDISLPMSAGIFPLKLLSLKSKSSSSVSPPISLGISPDKWFLQSTLFMKNKKARTKRFNKFQIAPLCLYRRTKKYKFLIYLLSVDYHNQYNMITNYR